MELSVFVSFGSLLLLAVFVEKNHCYSFDNHELNEDLRQSLEEYMYLAEDDVRGKRETVEDGNRPQGGHGGHHESDDDKFVCKHRHFKSCCGDENIMKKFMDKDKATGKACYRNVTSRMEAKKFRQNHEHMGDPMDLFSCEGLKNMKKKIYCVNECIGKKQQLLNDDGSLNAEKLKEFLMAEGFSEDWKKDLVTQGVDECLKKDYYKSSFSKDESIDTGDLNCNPTYLQFLSCLYKEIEMSCPEQYQKNSKKCKAMREHYVSNKKRMLDFMKN